MEMVVDNMQTPRYHGLEYPLVENSAMQRRTVCCIFAVARMPTLLIRKHVNKNLKSRGANPTLE
jgi:hypothetical protein